MNSEASLSPRGIMIVGVDGHNARELVPAPERMSTFATDWSRDGRHVLVAFTTPPTGPATQAQPRPSELRLVSPVDGSTSPTFTLPFAIHGARFSPDGRYIVLASLGSSLSILTLADGAVNRIAEDIAGSPFWTSDGSHVLFLRQRRTGAGQTQDLWSVPVSDGRANGSPAFLRSNIGDLQIATRDGGILYRAVNSTRDLYAIDIDPETGRTVSAPRQMTTWNDSRAPAWSPDGERLAFVNFGPQPGFEGSSLPSGIMIRSNATPTERRVVFATNASFRLTTIVGWFPDGQSLLGLCAKTLCRVDLQTVN